MVLGEAIYTTDVVPEDVVFVKPVRSTQPHALLNQIDPSRALKVSGVIAVLTAKDVPGINVCDCFGGIRPLFSYGRVRCRGEMVAAVIAESLASAEEAVDEIAVNYTPLPTLFSPIEAVEADAPRIHDAGNILKHWKVRKGDVERGFKDSSIIVENEYVTPCQEPVPLEPEASFATAEEDGSVTVVGSMQNPFYVQGMIAQILGVPQDRVRVIQAATGGSFGGKSDEAPMDTGSLAALAALKTRRTALVTYSREDSIIMHSKRHKFIMHYKTGARADGTLLASEITLYADTGAYASVGPLVTMRATVHATGPYVIPNVKTDGYCVYTNNTVAGSFRGFGQPQTAFAAESQIDEIAERLGINPLEMRMKNLLRPGLITATGQTLDSSVGLQECLELVAAKIGWGSHSPASNPKRKGLGLAAIYHGNSLGPEGLDKARARLILERNGTVTLRIGLTEYGTGARCGIAQIVAETVGIPVDLVRLDPVDTMTCPDSGGTFASRTLILGGRAAQNAAEKLRAFLINSAASRLKCKPNDVEFRGGIFSMFGRSNGISLEELSKNLTDDENLLVFDGEYVVEPVDFSEEKGYGTPYLQYTFGAVGAEVEVDTELGRVKPIRIVAAYDVGRAINPQLLEGQIEGATSQAVGLALMEEIVHKDGEVLNANLADYYVPTSLDMPSVTSILVERPGRIGPFGAKAMGEPPIDGPAAAIANAIFDAVHVRVRELPARPDRILHLTKQRAKAL
jgi:CO/xanthine dehydrogenase Mo-binding subunit